MHKSQRESKKGAPASAAAWALCARCSVLPLRGHRPANQPHAHHFWQLCYYKHDAHNEVA